jgi:hypothetical protein
VYGGVSPHETNTHTHHATSHTRATKRARPNLPNPRRHQKGGTVLSGVRPSGVKVFSMRVIFTVALVCLAAGHLFFLFNVYEYGCGTHVGWG